MDLFAGIKFFANALGCSPKALLILMIAGAASLVIGNYTLSHKIERKTDDGNKEVVRIYKYRGFD